MTFDERNQTVTELRLEEGDIDHGRISKSVLERAIASVETAYNVDLRAHCCASAASSVRAEMVSPEHRKEKEMSNTTQGLTPEAFRHQENLKLLQQPQNLTAANIKYLQGEIHKFERHLARTAAARNLERQAGLSHGTRQESQHGVQESWNSITMRQANAEAARRQEEAAAEAVKPQVPIPNAVVDFANQQARLNDQKRAFLNYWDEVQRGFRMWGKIFKKSAYLDSALPYAIAKGWAPNDGRCSFPSADVANKTYNDLYSSFLTQVFDRDGSIARFCSEQNIELN